MRDSVIDNNNVHISYIKKMSSKPAFVPRSGDWKCNCGTTNFASRNECFKCKASKPAAGSGGINIIKKKDWKCICGYINFESRVECLKCNHPKATQANAPCNCPIGNRLDCYKCKPTPTNAAMTFNTAELSKNDWKCTSCSEINFSKRIKCRKCNKSKDEAESKEEMDDPLNNNTCIVCFEREKDTVLLKCKHMHTCLVCSLNMKKCPVCRVDYNPDTDVLKVFT
jgi:hypothetical protein